MPCPTCDATLQGIGYGMFHCPRCGTLVNCPADGSVHVPALVERCRRLERLQPAKFGIAWPGGEWEQLGIAEAIHLPGERP